LIANAVNSLVAYNGATLVMCGCEAAAARASVGGTIVTMALVGLLVPSLGAEGAALAFMGGTLFRNAVNTVQAWRLLGLDTTVLGLRPRDPRTAAGSPPGSA
jgi:O-antigen/teichoic acid export membrane protein